MQCDPSLHTSEKQASKVGQGCSAVRHYSGVAGRAGAGGSCCSPVQHNTHLLCPAPPHQTPVLILEVADNFIQTALNSTLVCKAMDINDSFSPYFCIFSLL